MAMCTNPPPATSLMSAGQIERITFSAYRRATWRREVIDASSKLVAPGLVSAHYHSHDVLMKGIFEEAPFDIWASYTGATTYGTRTHREVRIRTLDRRRRDAAQRHHHGAGLPHRLSGRGGLRRHGAAGL